mmetsp:Transcript_85080/g.273877  ORF Transcript_85080/g.273877 Transcript_85080/m.273877 type:complete len:224 (+) Transcript_85080:11-682(+)
MLASTAGTAFQRQGHLQLAGVQRRQRNAPDEFLRLGRIISLHRQCAPRPLDGRRGLRGVSDAAPRSCSSALGRVWVAGVPQAEARATLLRHVGLHLDDVNGNDDAVVAIDLVLQRAKTRATANLSALVEPVVQLSREGADPEHSLEARLGRATDEQSAGLRVRARRRRVPGVEVELDLLEAGRREQGAVDGLPDSALQEPGATFETPLHAPHGAVLHGMQLTL